MNQDLPIHVNPIEEKGTITYATEVIATIVGVAATEVEGIASMAGAASISELLSGKQKNLSRGVKVEVGAEEVAVDVSVIVDYGMPIQLVSSNVQENIRKSIETMTGLHVIKVDVHVLGVSFEKENKELEQGQEVARLQSANQQQPFAGVSKEDVERPAQHVGRSKDKSGKAAAASVAEIESDASSEEPEELGDTDSTEIEEETMPVADDQAETQNEAEAE